MTNVSSDPQDIPQVGSTPFSNYRRPFEPPAAPALAFLPPGAIEPAGWLRDWCLAARDGYTGHMDEVDVAFRQAWAADYQMTGEALFWPKGGWPYEGGGYWFDGLVRLGYALHDKALIAQAVARTNVVVDNTGVRGRKPGIGFFWWLDRDNPADVAVMRGPGDGESEWPMWANGLFGRALAARCAAAPEARVRQALAAAYNGSPDWVRMGWGLSNPWPAHEAYRWTGDPAIGAALLALFTDPREEAPRWSRDRYRRMPRGRLALGATGGESYATGDAHTEANDHGVHFFESTAPWALGTLWTGDRAFFDAATTWQAAVEREAMQPHGVVVCDEFYGPTGAFRGTETCDVAASVWSKLLLLMVGGDGVLGDQIERAVFNAGAGMVSRDFKSHAYFQSPNRIADRALPDHERFSFQQTHWPLCCTAALNRVLPYYVTHMWMATPDDGLAFTAYGPCRVAALVADGVPVTLDCQTDYPFGETIEVAVNPAHAARFPLAFRVPGWCTAPALAVNGKAVAVLPDEKGFVRIDRVWAPGDGVQLAFPMAPEVATGVDRNREPAAPYATVSYGPLLFALPIPEAGDPNTPDPAARWQFALDTASEVTVERKSMPARWEWSLDAPLKLQASAVAFDWQPTLAQPLPAQPIAGGAREPITLVPYGTTMFRVSMFPVVERGG